MSPADRRGAEAARLVALRTGAEDWRRFGPYLAERQWGTVREDYSADPGVVHAFDVLGTTFTVRYRPGESDSNLFGGNSNWRGSIWFPVNYLLIESLQKFHPCLLHALTGVILKGRAPRALSFRRNVCSRPTSSSGGAGPRPARRAPLRPLQVSRSCPLLPRATTTPSS